MVFCPFKERKGKLEPHFARDVAEVPEILDRIVKENDIVLTQGAGNVVQVAGILKDRWKNGL